MNEWIIFGLIVWFIAGVIDTVLRIRKRRRNPPGKLKLNVEILSDEKHPD